MTDPDKLNCGTCRFWKWFQAPSPDGYCCLYPPVATIHREQGTVEYDQLRPVTNTNDFCGQHQGYKTP